MSIHLRYLTIIVILLVLIFFLRECQKCPECKDTTQTVIVNTKDTIKIKQKVPIYIYRHTPAPKPIKDTITDTINDFDYNIIIDCDSMYERLYSSNEYKSILKDDTSAFIQVDNCVSENKLQYQNLIYINRTPTLISKVAEAKRKLFVGASLRSDLNTLLPAVGIIYQTRKDHTYNLMIDPLNRSVEVGMFWKIKFK